MFRLILWAFVIAAAVTSSLPGHTQATDWYGEWTLGDDFPTDLKDDFAGEWVLKLGEFKTQPSRYPSQTLQTAPFSFCRVRDNYCLPQGTYEITTPGPDPELMRFLAETSYIDATVEDVTAQFNSGGVPSGPLTFPGGEYEFHPKIRVMPAVGPKGPAYFTLYKSSIMWKRKPRSEGQYLRVDTPITGEFRFVPPTSPTPTPPPAPAKISYSGNWEGLAPKTNGAADTRVAMKATQDLSEVEYCSAPADDTSCKTVVTSSVGGESRIQGFTLNGTDFVVIDSTGSLVQVPIGKYWATKPSVVDATTTTFSDGCIVFLPQGTNVTVPSCLTFTTDPRKTGPAPTNVVAEEPDVFIPPPDINHAPYGTPPEVKWAKQPALDEVTDVGDRWVVSGKPAPNGNGYLLYRYNTQTKAYDNITGWAVRIGGNYESPWIAQRNGSIGKWNVVHEHWDGFPGKKALDVAEGWIISNEPDGAAGNYKIYRYNIYSKTWEDMKGSALRIGGNYDHPWVVQANGDVYQFNGTGWTKFEGISASDIGDGWLISTTTTPSGNKEIYVLSNGKWTKAEGTGLSIAGPYAHPTVGTTAGNSYHIE